MTDTNQAYEYATSLAQSVQAYFAARAAYESVYDAAATAYENWEDADHDWSWPDSDLAALLRDIDPDAILADDFEAYPIPDAINDRDWAEDLGVLEVKQHATRTDVSDDWQLDRLEIVLTTGGPHAEIVIGDHGIRMDCYWGSDRASVNMADDATHAALEDYFEMLAYE